MSLWRRLFGGEDEPDRVEDPLGIDDLTPDEDSLINDDAAGVDPIGGGGPIVAGEQCSSRLVFMI